MGSIYQPPPINLTGQRVRVYETNCLAKDVVNVEGMGTVLSCEWMAGHGGMTLIAYVRLDAGAYSRFALNERDRDVPVFADALWLQFDDGVELQVPTFSESYTFENWTDDVQATFGPIVEIRRVPDK